MRNFQDNAVLGRRRCIADLVIVEEKCVLGVFKDPKKIGICFWSRTRSDRENELIRK